MARCLVVGGNGFVGSHLVDGLISVGHSVAVLDRFSGGLKHYASKGVTAHTGDFLNVDDLAKALHGVEYLFHFLSTTTPITAEGDPLLDLRTNVLGSVELFREAARAGVKRIYFASTGGAIYGDQGMIAMDETVAPAPSSPYAIGKLAIEGYLNYFSRQYPLQAVSFRLSNPYGPRQRGEKQGVVPIFLRAAMARQPITVYGDGSMVRDYIYVKDAVQSMVRAISADVQSPVLNIGSGIGYSINDVLSVIQRITGLPLNINRIDNRSTFVQRVVLDVSRYEREVGQQTLIALPEGIRLTWSDLLTRQER